MALTAPYRPPRDLGTTAELTGIGWQRTVFNGTRARSEPRGPAPTLRVAAGHADRGRIDLGSSPIEPTVVRFGCAAPVCNFVPIWYVFVRDWL